MYKARAPPHLEQAVNELVDSTLVRWLPGIAGSPDYELAARILRAYSAMPVEEIAQRHLDYRFEGFSPEMLQRAQEMLSPAAKPLLSVFPQYAATYRGPDVI